mmetsp:Transcript_1439/g.3423  ORF Transcript_1439/g.3423 Transcript_1439/m.3423 type:complete len:231 (+) Transcript_1439:158-850(+)
MQQTHFVGDELERERGLREPVTLQHHTDFATQVLGLGEREQLVHEVEEEARGGLLLWRGLLHHLGRRRWVLLVWAAEAVWLSGFALACCIELWNFCPFEDGPLLACSHCFGGVLSSWGLALASVWAFHLQLSVLLASRGFSFTVRFGAAANKGVPQAARSLLLVLSAALVCLLVLGCVLLAASGSCNRRMPWQGFAHVAPARPKAPLVLLLTGATLLAAPALLGLGRGAV